MVAHENEAYSVLKRVSFHYISIFVSPERKKERKGEISMSFRVICIMQSMVLFIVTFQVFNMLQLQQFPAFFSCVGRNLSNILIQFQVMFSAIIILSCLIQIWYEVWLMHQSRKFFTKICRHF